MAKRERKGCVPPTVEEIAAYCLERGNGIDPEAFWAHYESRGWTFKDGQPVVSWKACVITWEKMRGFRRVETTSKTMVTETVFGDDGLHGGAAYRKWKPE